MEKSWWYKVSSVVLLLGMLLSLSSPLGISAAPTAPANSIPAQGTQLIKGKPVAIDPVKVDVSPALSVMAANAPAGSRLNQEVPSISLGTSKAGLNRPAASDRDLAVQNTHNPDASMPSPIMNFDGVDNVNLVAPPDTQGDIGYDPATGKKYYVQWVNLSFAIWDVTAGTNGSESLVLGPVAGNTLWQGFGGDCETLNNGDPITLYDSISHRWLMSQFAVAGPYYQCIAISKTADPTGEYYRYAYQWTSGGVDIFNDYGKFGVWPDGYYMTANQFDSSDNWAGTGVAAFDRVKMLDGLPAQMIYFDLGITDWGGMLPSDLDGPFTPAPGTPNYFAEVHADEWDPSFTQDEVAIYEFTVDWDTPGNSTFTNVDTLTMTPFDGDMCGFSRDCITQQGTAQKVDAIADRTMYRLAYRNFGDHETLVGNLTVDADSTDHAGIRWFELRNVGGAWSIYQEGTYAPDANHRWMGSIAQDHDGNIALGYSVSGSATYPSVRYAGRLVGDPLGTLAQDETSMVAGSSFQGAVNRWGDYSMMSIDPVDDCTFWYTQEYVNTAGTWNWATRIGSFRFPTCAQATGTLTGTISDSGTSAPIPGATIVASRDITYTASTNSGPDGSYSLDLFGGDYSLDVSAYGYLPKTVNNVPITAGMTTVQNVALNLAASYVVSGTVTDALTGWPLYAKLDIVGYPGGTVWTDPVTGFYSVTLAGGTDYTFNVEAWVPGYLPGSQMLTVSGDQTLNFGLDVDAAICTAPGYSASFSGFSEDFESWPPTGWSVVDNISGGGVVWDLDSTYADTNYTGGSGHAADANSDANALVDYDTELRTPVLDLSGLAGSDFNLSPEFPPIQRAGGVRRRYQHEWRRRLEQPASLHQRPGYVIQPAGYAR